MKFLHIQNTQSSRFAIFSVFLICCVWFFGGASVASAQLPEEGDGVYFYGLSATTPYAKLYDNSTNTFGATTTLPTGGVIEWSEMKASPTQNEMVAAYTTNDGKLYVLCFDGTSWTNEWSIDNGLGAITRRFDIGYETDTGDVMVLYSSTATGTNELSYRTKSGSAGCGSGNWSSENNLDPIRTSGEVQWVKIAEDKRAGSNLMMAVWSDLNRDLSAMTWSGTAWGNEHTAALETTLEVASVAQDVQSFDVAYESVSGDVMVTWGSGGTNGTNGAYYATCTGGTASCTWTGVRTAMPTFLDDATHISIAADPLTDQIAFASIGNAGADMQLGIWSGSAWTNTANADASSQSPTGGRKMVSAGWLNNNGIKRAVVNYHDGAATNVGWFTASGTTWTQQTDFTPSVAFSTQQWFETHMNPYDNSELLLEIYDSNRRVFAKRLQMDGTGAFTWTNADGGVLAAQTNLSVYNQVAYAYWRSVPVPPSFGGTLYLDQGITPAGSGKTINIVIGTSSPSVYSTATDSSGQWVFTDLDMTNVTATTSFIIFLDGDTSRATTLVSGYTAGALSDIPLYYNILTAYAVSSEAVVPLEEFDIYDSSDDTDILYTASSTEFIAHAEFIVEQGELVQSASTILEGGFTNNASVSAGAGNTTVSGFLGRFLSGLDVTGTSSGTGALTVNGMAAAGNYLYVAKNGSGTACSQTAGSAGGCELMVFDVSDPENPIYVAGRDADGSTNGTNDLDAYRVHVVGDYLYVGGNFSNTACDATPGSAIGCELKVYNISIPTNPQLVGGVDGSGSPTGTALAVVSALESMPGYLFVGKGGDGSGACSQSAGSAAPCEIMVFDISDPANPTYVAGRDSSGSAAGSTGVLVYGLEYHDGYLYVAKDFNNTACSQSAGSAVGCELMVFDVTTPTSPTYVAGRDDDGSPTNGDGNSNTIQDLIAKGDYLYTVKYDFNGQACAQSVGGAGGCELAVYDISDPTNPTYVAGRDADGSAAGTARSHMISVQLFGDALYVTKEGSATACSAFSGSAAGCEIMVFDISSSTNPVLANAVDVSGAPLGTSSMSVFSSTELNNRLFTGTVGTTTACSSVPGSALGCEIKAFTMVPELGGTYAGTDRLNNVEVAGGGVWVTGSVRTNDFTISDGRVAIPGVLEIEGDLSNADQVVTGGGEIILAGTSKTVSGNFVGDNAFDILRVTGSYEITSSQASTTNLVIEAGGTLTAPATLSVERRMHNDGTFDNNNGTVLLGQSDVEMADYILGISKNGNVLTGGGEYGPIEAMIMVGNYLYTGGDGNEFSCSQTPGSAGPCELLVFDLKDPLAPVLVYSFSANGSNSGTGGAGIKAFALNGSHLYVGKGGNSTACSQTPGSASGCEIMVLDVSNPAVPVYVAGRDVSGSAAGTESLNVMSLAFYNDHLYVGKYPEGTACSQSAGSAIGCEIMVFDVSTPTSPTYVAGRDADGSSDGTTGPGWEAGTSDMLVVDNYLYVARAADGECFVAAGQAEGCALQIYDIATGNSPTLVGTLTNNGQRTYEYGYSEFYSLAIAEDTLYVGKQGQGKSCAQVAGNGVDGCELQVYDISSTTNPVYIRGFDVSGTPNGGVSYGQYIKDMQVADGNLYLTKFDTIVSCIPTAGMATGCDMHIYDIASTTNPVFVTGRDRNGSYGVAKDDSSETNAILVHDGYVYVAGFEFGTACPDEIGDLYSCAILVYQDGTAGVLTGEWTDGSEINTLEMYGTTVINATASTSDLLLAGDFFSLHPTELTIQGDLSRGAGVNIFSHDSAVYFDSTSAQSISGNFVGLESLPDVYFAGVGTKTVSGVASTTHITVAAGAPVVFESTLDVIGALVNAGTLTSEGWLNIFGRFENTGSVDILNDTTFIGNPIIDLVGAVDSNGYVLGTAGFPYSDFVISGNYLYATKSEGSGDCAADLSDGSGCHLQIFDISDPTNLVYVRGILNSGGNGEAYGEEAYALAATSTYLYVGRFQNGDNCDNPSYHVGCELVVYDISSSTDPIFAAGRDSDGSISGTTDNTRINTMALEGEYLYVGKNGNDTACSQSVGSAVGCEIMVFDISSSTNPVYVAGRDVSGNAVGTVSVNVLSIEVVGDYLYVGKEGDDTACSQSAGSARGCELLVFDISDPTDPVYVAGRDSDGSSTGTQTSWFNDFTVDGDYLYVGQGYGYGACSSGNPIGCHIKVFDISTPASITYVGGAGAGGPLGQDTGAEINSILAYGDVLYISTQTGGHNCNTFNSATEVFACEFMAFDISSSTNPVYLAARDLSGGLVGTFDLGAGPMVIQDDYLYLGIQPRFELPSAHPCVPTAGEASGCELQVYNISPTLQGGMTGSNAFADLTVSGVGAVFESNATVATLTIEHGEVTAPAVLTVEGDFINNDEGTFNANGGEVVLGGDDQMVFGTTTFFDLTKQAAGAATTTFEAGSLTTVLSDWTFSGASSETRHVLRSSVDSEYWYINASTTLVSNLAVKDSNNLNVTTITCGSGCIDNTGNVNWSFEEVLELSILSSAPHTFYFNQPTTTLGSVVITEGGPATITTTDDIRIRIATSTTNFRFDAATTELSFGGTASGKVSGTVSYEQDDAVLVINVTSNFVAGETLVIDGIKVGSFVEASAGTSVLALYTNGGTTGEPAALDTQPIRILGGLILEDHPEGQVANQFGALNVEDAPFFAFRLETVGEETLVEDLTLSLLGLGVLTTENILNFRLYRDNDSDSMLDGGDSLIDGAGIFTINGQNGAVTFSTNFTASSSVDYLIVADTFAIPKGASVNVTLTNTAFAGVGSISGITPVLVSTISSVQHIRANAGTTGGSVGVSRVGGSAPAGASTETGGASGGGAPAGQTDGENIASETDYYKPTTSGALDNEWTDGINALLSDGNYASAASTNLRQSYSGFPFVIPSGNSIQGIGIKIDASGSTPAGTIDVALTWDNGETYTTGKATPTLVGSDVVYMIGGASDLAPEVFRVRVTATTDNNTLRLDAIEVRVYHQTSGGSSGGGSGGGRS